MAFAQIVRSMIDAENKLISDRLGWLLTAQSLLFAGVGVAWGKPTASPLILVMCGLGLGVSVAVLLPLIGATLAQYRLSEWWNVTHSESYSGPPVRGLEPTRFEARFKLLAPWTWIPFLFIVAWGVIFYFRLR